MNYIDIIQRFVIDRYPTERSARRWRSSESKAAIAELRRLVAAGDSGALRRAVSYFIEGPNVNRDAYPELYDFRPINPQGRLYKLLLDAKQATMIPENFTRADINPVLQGGRVYILGNIDSDELDIVGWLSYFLAEKGRMDALNQNDKMWLLDFLNVFYTRPNPLNSVNNLPKKMDGGIERLLRLSTVDRKKYKRKDRVMHEIMKEVLKVLLHWGLMPVAECNDQHEVVRIPENSVLEQYKQWDTVDIRRQRAQNALGVVQHPGCFCWRGDSRTYTEVKKAGGLWSKATSESYAEAKNMRKDWHPFSEWETRKYIYYRCHQNDNCLYTAVSVTPAVETGDDGTLQFTLADDSKYGINVCFPQLEEIPQGKRRRVRVRLTPVPAGASETRNLYVDEVRLFLCYLRSNRRFVDTMQLQRDCGSPTFPEIAVRGIKIADIKGYIVYIRIHHGNTNAEGFTAIPVGNQSSNLSRNDAAATAMYDSAYAQFEGAWGPNGIQQPEPANQQWQGSYRITRVGSMVVGADGRIERYVPLLARA